MAAVTERVADHIRYDVPQRIRLDFAIRQIISALTLEANQGPEVVPVVTDFCCVQSADLKAHSWAERNDFLAT